MEAELEYLREQVDEAFNKILPWKEGGPYPFWLYIREEYDKVREKFDSLETMVSDWRSDIMYSLENLKGIKKKLRRNKDSILYLMPSWCVPIEPLPANIQYQDDFSQFADYLYRMVQFLESLLEKIPDSYDEYEGILDGIKKDIKRSVYNYRNDIVVAQFWKASIELREMLHVYPTIIDDVTSRYEEKQ
jgi:hypothetical protein